jgi:hypothetical protein
MQTQLITTPSPDQPTAPKPNPPAKRFPASLQAMIRPMLYASIALHGLILLVPLSGEGDKPKVPKDQGVKVTQLPPTTKGASQAKPNSKTAVLPKIPVRVKPLIRASSSTIPAEPKNALQQPEAAEQNPATPSKDLQPNMPPGTPTNDPFADFPRYPKAIPGSGGVLSAAADGAAMQTPDDINNVINFFQTEAPKKKFDIQPVSDQGEVKIFQVSKDGSAPQYLHLIKKSNGTVILLAPQKLSIDDLKNSKVSVEAPEARELDTLLADGLSAQISLIGIEDLPDPSKFTSDVDGFKAEVGDAYRPDGSPISAAEFADLLNGLISNSGFTLAPDGSYGGGSLYEVKKNSYTGYVSVVPTADGSAAVYTWTKKPS